MKRTLASSSADMSIIIRIYVIIKGRKQLIIDSFLMSVIKVASWQFQKAWLSNWNFRDLNLINEILYIKL